jgi:hypothetical protein
MCNNGRKFQGYDHGTLPSIYNAHSHPQHIALPFELGGAKKPILTNSPSLLKFNRSPSPSKEEPLKSKTYWALTE